MMPMSALPLAVSTPLLITNSRNCRLRLRKAALPRNSSKRVSPPFTFPDTTDFTALAKSKL